MFKEHPGVVWAGGVITAIGILSSFAGVLWYFEDERNRNIGWEKQDQKWNAEQLAKLDELHADHDALRRDLTEAINRAMMTMAIELGKVSERTKQ